MAISQTRSKRKTTGGRYKKLVKRLTQLGRAPTLTKIGETKSKSIRSKSGCQKHILLATNKVNVLDPKTKKTKIVLIKTVAESPANRNYVRSNTLTKGSIVDTELGKVKITSRPGQEKTVNGVLLN